MATTKLPVLPADKHIADDAGNLTDPYWLFFDALSRALRNGTGSSSDSGVTINGVQVTY
jgi:hypothetical protein